MSHADLSELAAIALALPRDLGLELRLWRAEYEPDDVPTVGVRWQLYAVKAKEELYPEAGDIWGVTEEGPLSAASYLLEQLEAYGAPYWPQADQLAPAEEATP